MTEGKFSRNGKWPTPTIKDKKVTYSNSSFKLWTEKIYAIELILVKSYKKCLIFVMGKTLRNITNHHYLKLVNVFSQFPIAFKVIVLSYSNCSQYSGVIKTFKKFTSSNKKFTSSNLILQTKWFIKFIIYLTCKVFIETAVKFRNV